MPRSFCIAVGVVLGCALQAAEPAVLSVPSFEVGRNLQVFTSAKLSQPAPGSGLSMTVSSDNADSILLSESPDRPGSRQLTLALSPGAVESPDFYVQALNGTGVATYTASAPGYAPAKGKVTIARSGVVAKMPQFRTTARTPARVMLYSVMLDDSGKPVRDQPVRAGFAARIRVASSNPDVGAVLDPEIVIPGAAGSAMTLFKPKAPGQTVLKIGAPEGFDTPAEGAEIQANADVPGIGMMGEVRIGKDLQVEGDILLGENAPEEGLDVTLTSNDPQKVVLSPKIDAIGSGTLTIHIPGGQGRGHYSIQALSDSGDVTYTASAAGYRTRTAPLTLVPSGVLIAYAPNGPPDHANVTRAEPPMERRDINTSLAKKQPVQIGIWMAYLDPTTKRGADMTVQRLRPGVQAEIRLLSSDPSVAEPASITIAPSRLGAVAEFVPRREGQTVISATTPKGFTTASNATSLKIIVAP